jgi:hypothetical protein
VLRSFATPQWRLRSVSFVFPSVERDKHAGKDRKGIDEHIQNTFKTIQSSYLSYSHSIGQGKLKDRQMMRLGKVGGERRIAKMAEISFRCTGFGRVDVCRCLRYIFRYH